MWEISIVFILDFPSVEFYVYILFLASNQLQLKYMSRESITKLFLMIRNSI